MPHYWVPTLKKTVLYSEILDRFMNITVTERTLSLIDQNYGFDSYILNVSIILSFYFYIIDIFYKSSYAYMKLSGAIVFLNKKC